MAGFTVDGQPIRLAVDPAVKKLAKGQVTIGIRPRALYPGRRGRRRHDRRPRGTDRADGRRDPYPRPDAAWQRPARRRAARDQGQGGRCAQPSHRCARDACVRRLGKGGARMSDEMAIAGKGPLGGMSPVDRAAPRMGPHRARDSCAGAYFPAVQPGAVRGRLRACRLRRPRQQPLAALPARNARSLVVAGVIVALTFFVVMLISIVAAYLYGVFLSTRSRPIRASRSIASRSYLPALSRVPACP